MGQDHFHYQLLSIQIFLANVVSKFLSFNSIHLIYICFLIQHPWTVSIQTLDGYLHCGGSIAASNKIITAAHCFTDQQKKEEMSQEKIRSFRVVAGTDTPFDFHGTLVFIKHIIIQGVPKWC